MTERPPDFFLENPLSIKDMIHPDYSEYFETQWKNLLDGKAPPSYEYKILLPNGGEKWIFQSNRMVFDEDGRISALEGLCRDITESKRAAQFLEDEQQKMTILLDTIPAFISLKTPDCRIHFANKRFRDLFGEPAGRFCYEIVEGVEEPCPDLILLDIVMPEMDGFETIQIIRDSGVCRNIPVIGVSAGISDADVNRITEAGFAGFLRKPLNITHLLEVIKTHMGIEWRYRDDAEGYLEFGYPARIIPPSKAELEILYESAMLGFLDRTIRFAARLKEVDHDLGPFADCVMELCTACDDQKLLSFIERYLYE